MQNRAIRLMASKLAVAGIIEGNFTDEGFAAMSDCADMKTALARELTAGIKNEVEDLSAVFKKMAILKPAAIADTFTDMDDSAITDIVAVAGYVPEIPVPAISLVYIRDDTRVSVPHSTDYSADYVTDAPMPSLGLLSFVNQTRPVRAARGNFVFADGKEESLYDLYEQLAA